MCVCLYVAMYLLYAKLEEEHGLARHAMSVYERATKAVSADQQLEVLLASCEWNLLLLLLLLLL